MPRICGFFMFCAYSALHVRVCIIIRQNTELNNLRSECSSLMKDLAETKNKLQQEELQRKSLEVNYKQNVSQLEVLFITHTAFSAPIAYWHAFFAIFPWKSSICTTHQAQLQDAKRRWEELQSYLHSVNTEREKLQAAKQGWCFSAVVLYTCTHTHTWLLSLSFPLRATKSAAGCRDRNE